MALILAMECFIKLKNAPHADWDLAVRKYTFQLGETRLQRAAHAHAHPRFERWVGRIHPSRVRSPHCVCCWFVCLRGLNGAQFWPPPGWPLAPAPCFEPQLTASFRDQMSRLGTVFFSSHFWSSLDRIRASCLSVTQASCWTGAVQAAPFVKRRTNGRCQAGDLSPLRRLHPLLC